MSKYDPLYTFLENAVPDLLEMALSFRQVEIILGFVLPPSARQYRSWWENPGTPDEHSYAQAWLAAGWKVDKVDLHSEWVRFQKLG